jgi:anaerobic dimethyl sulfoxide reductase subunit C (anchor subunit)
VGSFAVRNVIAWVAAAVGLVMVYSMAHIYMVRTQPAWDTIATPITFFTTTLLLGVLAMGAAFVANYAIEQRKNPGCADVQCELLRDTIRGIAICSIVLLGVEFVVLPLYLGYLAIAGSAATVSANLLVNTYGMVFIIRLVLAFVGAGVCGIFLYQNAATAGAEKTMATLVYSAFAMVLVAEVMGRFLFYISEYRIGV